ncbi:DUF370 domain-containing protein [Bacillus shivajii]|uniref:extracellular matrix regulator RemB n=1 Tax=Bacillus shivajii TaxID=1983719 RepID=UPI001CFACC43|nr:DUF370 domain-containing protein [Bacillus shivajii]UCZ53258.1 DUF370 domain-containing protein [Bacillus shivajii]
MFIHLGGDMVLSSKKIVAILDHNSNDLSQDNQDFIKSHEDEKKTVPISDDTPKSIIITDDYIYLSPISSHTLKRRAETFTDAEDEE